MKNVKIYCDEFAPSKNLIPELVFKQYKFRQTGKYFGKSEVGIGLMGEPVWWNRPLKSDVFIKQELDGLYSLNFPYFEDCNSFKTQYNALANVGCIPVLMQLRFKDFEKPIDKPVLINMPLKVVGQTLVELGVDKESLQTVHNDLLYQGKKFMGVETIFKNNCYSSIFIITLFYKPEEEIFKRLTGKYALRRPITGIIEETNLFTREEFIEKFMHNINEFLKTL